MPPPKPPPPTPRAGRSPLPLAYRLPNPPALFVGRRVEVAAIDAALARGPLAVIAGEGGIGKSALALHFLKQRRAALVDSAVFVSLRGGDAREPVALGAARALTHAAGLRGVDWPDLLGAPDALGAFALDLAEERAALVVLDDLHHGDAAETLAFLRQIARYARKSRWIATTRAAPAADELAGQVIGLAAMSAPDLTKLARALDPAASPAMLRDAVAAAEGSPWRLRRTRAGSPDRAADALGDLSDATRGFLQALSLVSVALPPAILERVAPRPAEEIDALARRGLIERSSSGVRLHDLTRELLPSPAGTPFWRDFQARAGAALAEAAEPELRVQAAGLLLGAGHTEAAAALLDAAGEALLASGYAPALWRMLEAPRPTSPADPRLERWRLRSAVDLADAEALASARPPVDADPATRVLWAQILQAKGRAPEAAEIAGAAHEAALAAGDAALAFRAGLIRAQSTGNAGDLAQACRQLEALAPPDPAAAADRDAILALALAIVGDLPQALERAEGVRRRLPDLPPPLRDRAGRRVSRTYSFLGRIRDARAVLDTLHPDGAGASVRLEAGRELRYMRATLALDGGDLDGAARELDRLEPHLGRASLMHVIVAVTWASLAFARGDLGDVDARLAEISGERLPPSFLEATDALALRLRVLRREPPPPRGPSDAPAMSVHGAVLRIHRIEIELRHRVITPAQAIAALDELRGTPEVLAAARVVKATAALLDGDAERALAEATTTAAEMAEAGFALAEIEARRVACESLTVLGRREALARAAADLGRLARSMPSARFERSARLHATLAADHGPDVALLEELASDASIAPDVAFHARALLGGDARGDALDDRVRAAIRRDGWTPPTPITSPPRAGAWQPGWGLDEPRRRVWLPDGRRVDLTRHPTPWRILLRLCAHGGTATKEQLVVEVWEERDYHPLRHDNRLQAAIRKLRIEIEDDASRPARVLTTTDGYALGGVVRRVAAPG